MTGDRFEMPARRFRRKPQVIEAIQYRPDIPNCGDIARFTGLIPPDGAWECDEEPHDDQPWHLTMAVSAFIGDWVVKYGEDDFGVLRNGQLLADWEPCDE